MTLQVSLVESNSRSSDVLDTSTEGLNLSPGTSKFTAVFVVKSSNGLAWLEVPLN